MRLIDADALMKEFTAQTPFGCGTVGIKFVDDLIKNQPTAYDVEEKVAELGNAMKTALDKVKLPIPIVISKQSLQEVVDMCFGEAISIVRGKE